MLFEPASTAADLRFRVLGIPVRIHPMFWLIAFLLGWSLPLAEQLVWVAVVFVSVLVHEMGHALGSRAFGQRTHVVLYSLGGLTVPEGAAPGMHAWRQACVATCGPLAGFVLAGAAYVALPPAGAIDGGPVGALRYHLVWVNVAWGVVNLLPVWPLDGGHVTRAILVQVAGDRGFSVSSLVSLATAIVVAAWAWNMGQPLIALFFAYFGFMEWQRSV
jgi:Zn-dependent protease